MLIERTRDIGVHAQSCLQEPNYISESAGNELCETLKLLESRVLSIAVQIKQLEPS